jgi:hypothetical protein
LLSLLRPKIFRIEVEVKDIKKITGLKILIIISRSHEAGRATFSGFFAAKVLGVFSAKIRITIVRIIEAIITEPSPYNFIDNRVAILAARILTKLLPKRIPPIK